MYGSTVNTGNGNDTVTVSTFGKNSTINLGAGDDSITIDKKMYLATLNTGTGNDTVKLNKDIHTDATIDTGDGNDTITIGGSISNGHINTGSGDDTISTYYLRNDSSVSTGSGSDIFTITDVLGNFEGTVSMGDSDDELIINDNRLDRINTGSFTGGSGNDVLRLPRTSLREWNNGASDLFSGFETIILEDTTLSN